MHKGEKPSRASGEGFFLWGFLSKNRETLLLLLFGLLVIVFFSGSWQGGLDQGLMLLGFYLIPLALAGYAYYCYRRMKGQLLQTLEVLSTLTERNVLGKVGHSRRVAELADWLAVRMGMSRRMRKHLRRAALYHDIGKLVLKEDEPGEEAHALAGQRILQPIPFLVDASRWVGMHHQPYLGEKIELAARILHVADFVDTLVVQGKSREEIDTILKLEKGKRIDPVLAELIISGWWRRD